MKLNNVVTNLILLLYLKNKIYRKLLLTKHPLKHRDNQDQPPKYIT